MDFQNVNLLNVRLNLVSGNLLPMIIDSPFSFFWKTYSAFVWTSQFILGIVMVLGCVYVPIEKALKDGLICFVVFIEMFFMVLRIHARNDLMYQLIQKLNAILRTTDETMKSVVTATLESVKIPLNFYWSAGMVSIIAWYGVPFLYDKNLFYYEDYRIPAAFTKQPFSRRVFVLTSIFILIIALMTSLLKELMSLNFSLIYVNTVFRFCFMGIFLSTHQQHYGKGFGLLCSHQSTGVTDKAFHENWHLLQPSIKHIFILIIMANNLECKIATFKNFNFSLPSFMTILNQSYSIALLFLRMK
ncbi:PREDICTED: uncharacterized protein LOC105450608 [Wasmannia auropunctata]|uniref:uncharacterized protein LOC105450608 n=1 Tax=Wasmannia auropunctata TaxID=64793 RepID=UPI0005F067F9|nr:PREDICTED: uncharacterized protein LOC105450608 [Wasmannia auropunctata]